MDTLQQRAFLPRDRAASIQSLVREEKVAEEKPKRKVSVKKMWDTEARKQKALQMEEEQKFEEQPEKWKTVGEIRKMLEHNSAKQTNERHHGQQDKEKWVKHLDLAVVTEEEENQKEEKSPMDLELLPQEEKAKHVEVVPAASKWLNITAQDHMSLQYVEEEQHEVGTRAFLTTLFLLAFCF
ncbi:UNVERIFIED_CONTAM: hypothetical protein K2H54_062716 [Gekko kuhli]